MHTLQERGGVEVIGPRGWMTYCRLFHEAGLQPFSDAIQVQVDAHQAQLPSPLDQLVRLHHQPLEEKDKHGRFEQDAHGVYRVYRAFCVTFYLDSHQYVFQGYKTE